MLSDQLLPDQRQHVLLLVVVHPHHRRSRHGAPLGALLLHLLPVLLPLWLLRGPLLLLEEVFKNLVFYRILFCFLNIFGCKLTLNFNSEQLNYWLLKHTLHSDCIRLNNPYL